jgi:L-arabinokinase
VSVVAYYVSGHGFGHARRTAQVLRTLGAMRANVRAVVRTSAPPVLFDGLSNTTVSVPSGAIDAGVVERDTLSIDPVASMRRLAEILARRESIVAREVEFLRESRAALVVADIPFLGADAAELAGLDCVGVGNFTWDWIFEPFATAGTQSLISEIQKSHRKMCCLLHLPLGHEVTGFREVIDVPLLANRARQDRRATLAGLGVDPDDARPRVLIAMRGGLSVDTLIRAVSESPELLFIVNQAITGAPPNLRAVHAGVDFTEVLAACDVVVSKLGYGILSDCIANGVALLFPPRTGFREDEISRAVCPRYMRMRELPVADFNDGCWGAHLGALLAQPPPLDTMRSDGDQVVAQFISRRC